MERNECSTCPQHLQHPPIPSDADTISLSSVDEVSSPVEVTHGALFESPETVAVKNQRINREMNKLLEAKVVFGLSLGVG